VRRRVRTCEEVRGGTRSPGVIRPCAGAQALGVQGSLTPLLLAPLRGPRRAGPLAGPPAGPFGPVAQALSRPGRASLQTHGVQSPDAPAAQTLSRLRVPRRRGRPRTRPAMVLADKAYSSREIRGHLRQRGIRAVIPERADQQANRVRRGQAGGRPPAFDREAYKQRNTVERCINRLKQWRGIATRHEKTATVYLAGLRLAGIFLWPARCSPGNRSAPGERVEMEVEAQAVVVEGDAVPLGEGQVRTPSLLLVRPRFSRVGE